MQAKKHPGVRYWLARVRTKEQAEQGHSKRAPKDGPEFEKKTTTDKSRIIRLDTALLLAK